MSTPDTELHEIKAMLFRLAGDHAELAKRLTGLEDQVAEQAVAVDEVEAALLAATAALSAPSTVGAEPTAPTDPTDPAGEPPVLDLHRLVAWVDVNVAGLLQRRVPLTGGYPYWCRQWWQHPEAVIRFEAARRSWEEAIVAGPGNALVVYFEHLDHQLGVLCSDNGPFSGCTGGRHTADSPAELLGQDPPSKEYLDEYLDEYVDAVSPRPVVVAPDDAALDDVEIEGLV